MLAFRHLSTPPNCANTERSFQQEEMNKLPRVISAKERLSKVHRTGVFEVFSLFVNFSGGSAQIPVGAWSLWNESN